MGDKSKSDSVFSLFFSFIFVFFCFSLFFLFLLHPPRPITIFCLCSLKMKSGGARSPPLAHRGRHLWRHMCANQRPWKMKQEQGSGRRDLASPFHFFASVKMTIIIVITIIQQILNKSKHPSRWGGASGRVTTPMGELSMLVSF